VHFLQMKEWSEAAKSVPLSSIWGVGGKLEMRYKQHGLLTVADLLAADTARIKQLFGVHGIRLQKELLGQSALLFDDVREPQKSIMSSRSFGKETTQASVVHDAVAYHVRHALEDLRSMRCKASVIRVSIRPSRHGDYVLRGGSKEAVFAVPTNNTIEVLKVAKELTESLFEAGVPYKKAGVVLAGFTSVDAAQQSLFADESTLKSDALMPVIDLLNKRLGKDAVTIGSHHKVSKWQALSELKSPSYTTRWSDVREVKT
jgi:DNA polymerase V